MHCNYRFIHPDNKLPSFFYVMLSRCSGIKLVPCRILVPLRYSNQLASGPAAQYRQSENCAHKYILICSKLDQ